MRIYYFILYTKRKPKWINDLNGGNKPIKVLDDDIGQYLYDIHVGKNILNLNKTHKSINHKEIINKFNILKLRTSCY